MDKANMRKGAGIVSLVLGVLAWLGDRYAWFTAKTSEGLNALSLTFGAVATFG